jgi:Zn-dependent protease with chaperone function
VNFFERQNHVRRMSARLVVLFVIAVIAIVAVVDLAVLLAFRRADMSTGQIVGLVVASSITTVLAITLAASFRTIGLRGGGGVVARELGGVLVPQDTQDPQLRRLRNVVEEIAIASGTPVPEIYVMPNEKGINAFAAGWSTSDAAVSVTQGALERLNRTELQGVIGHEFSHVVNGDMRLNIRLIGLLFGILFLAVIGRTLTYGGLLGGGGRRDRNNNNGNPLVIIGIALLAVGFVGVIAGRFIKAAVSRQREYLADASAVQYTRQTSGIVGALAKIAGLEVGSQLRNPKREEVGHMLFGSGASFSALLATHPPLEDRIKALDPSFDLNRLPQLSRQWAAHPPVGLEEDAQLGLAPATVGAAATASAPAPSAPTAAVALPAPQTRVPVVEADVLSGVGAPDFNAYSRAESLIGQIPADILDRARNPQTVVPLVLGLLMADDPTARTAQHTLLAQRYGQPLADAVWSEGSALSGLHPLLKLPLAELAFPALKRRSLAERSTVVNQVSELIHADGVITAHEYCLSRLVYSELGASIQPPSQWRTGGGRLGGARDAVVTLLSVVAFAGNEDPQAAAHAFRAGLQRVLPGVTAAYQPPTDGVTVLETAWPALTTLSPADTQQLVAGVVSVINDDGVTTVTEMELLRTICGLLHCPLPL